MGFNAALFVRILLFQFTVLVTAKITFEQRTLTVGLGENVEIVMTTNQPMTDLRWTHNYGDVISKWNGSSTIKIENVRKQDGGVYECYQDEYGKDGNHGIMRLIVRACPSPKWNPPSCELDCPVCYNGGVCDDITGLCICPAGFKGANCEIGCGSNYFGRFCSVLCSWKSEESCKEKVFCPPDPVGCNCIDGYGGLDCSQTCGTGWYGASCQQMCRCNVTYCDRKYGCNNDSCWDGYTGPQCQVGCNCIAGYGGLDCSQTCGTGWYGASCQQMCHCNVTYCDRKYGCINDSCWDGYTGPQCQVLSSDISCPSGFFGKLCNYPCHCSGGDDCNRDDGSCINGCNESWAGSNCSIALPYLNTPPIATAYTSAISVDVTWTLGRHYGTGAITSWTLWYKKAGNSEFTSINSSTPDIINITGLNLHETVTYYSILSRSIEGVNTAGPASPQGIIQTTCLEPLSPSPPTIKSVARNYLEIQWEVSPKM
ncbi:multiple epidermal growth factor-like domains protein 11 [Anneissia japonica]|uniref:multiple epidermal growth factor-like domains protein 11 n=1 Tax=Anneissia japonica TaxID=1529436 RepID=UPI0014256F9A|nr:multiple epidermal growth factor-like domains protein 11 [Anneissia japonica]